MNAALLVGSMLLLTFLGMPIVFSMLAASILTILIHRPHFPDEVFAQYFVAGVQS